MASAAQITANRLNAQHSTGPRTLEGKARSSQNALKSGFCSAALVVPPEMRAEFDEYRAGLLKSTAPQTAIEEDYFRRMLLSGWNLIRVQEAETQELFGAADATRLDLLTRYRRDLERSYDRALKALRELQRERVARCAASAEMREALAEEAPLAVPPRPRPMTSAEMREIIDQSVVPTLPRSEPDLAPGLFAAMPPQALGE